MDGLLYDPDHPLANDDGFRTDYIEAARELELTNMRWPGGNYLASYDWRDGIGPKENRPVRRELAWNVLERNHVGTDEWIALSRAMGVENSICINAGTGTWDDARYWVEYVNSPTGSYYADLRAEHGHPEPYNVRYWHIGNEVDGEPWQAVYSTPQEYVRFAKNAANIMYFVNRGCESCMQPTFLAMGSSWVSHDGVPGPLGRRSGWSNAAVPARTYGTELLARRGASRRPRAVYGAGADHPALQSPKAALPSSPGTSVRTSVGPCAKSSPRSRSRQPALVCRSETTSTSPSSTVSPAASQRTR